MGGTEIKYVHSNSNNNIVVGKIIAKLSRGRTLEKTR